MKYSCPEILSMQAISSVVASLLLNLAGLLNASN